MCLRQSVHADLESLLVRMKKAGPGTPERERIRNALLLSVRGIVVRRAEALIGLHSGVELADLVQEGLLGVLPYLERFRPGLAPGKSLLPGYVATIARQRMVAYAQEVAAPVRITSAGRRRAARATKRAKAEGLELAHCLADEGLSPAHYSPAGPIDVRLVAVDRAQQGLEDHQEAQALHRALWQLPRPERFVVRALFGFDGQPSRVRTVAERLGVGVAQVEEIRDRALARARTLIEQGSGTCPPSSPVATASVASVAAASSGASTRTGAPAKGSSTRSVPVKVVYVSTNTQAPAAAAPSSARAGAGSRSESVSRTASGARPTR
jgi:RNA polymerase sigma factor (sigma-70 family)